MDMDVRLAIVAVLGACVTTVAVTLSVALVLVFA